MYGRDAEAEIVGVAYEDLRLWSLHSWLEWVMICSGRVEVR